MNDPYPRTQPNIIGNFTHARCTRCHKPWIVDKLPVMGTRGAA